MEYRNQQRRNSNDSDDNELERPLLVEESYTFDDREGLKNINTQSQTSSTQPTYQSPQYSQQEQSNYLENQSQICSYNYATLYFQSLECSPQKSQFKTQIHEDLLNIPFIQNQLWKEGVQCDFEISIVSIYSNLPQMHYQNCDLTTKQAEMREVQCSAPIPSIKQEIKNYIVC